MPMLAKLIDFVVKIGAWILGAFGFGVAAETGSIAAKAARVSVYVTVVTAAFAAMYDLVLSSLSVASAALPGNIVSVFSALAPSNLTLCISLVLGARFARFIFDQTSRIAKMLAED